MLNFGIIGCGHVARVAHIPILRRMRGVRVAAIADSDATSLDRAHQLVPRAARHRSVESILSDSQLNTVVIALPSSLHARTAAAAFDRGLHVYLEKPVALNMHDAATVLAAWRAAGTIGAVGHNTRFNSLCVRLARAVRDGAAGNVRRISTSFNIPAPPVGSWRTRIEEGGALFDLATHHFDLLGFLLDEKIDTVGASVLTNERVKLQFRFASGARGEVECAYSGPFSNQITVEGERRILRVDLARSWDVQSVDSDGHASRQPPTASGLLHASRKLLAPFNEPSFARALEEFVIAVQTRSSFSPDIADGARTLAVAATALKAAESGLPVTVEYPD